MHAAVSFQFHMDSIRGYKGYNAARRGSDLSIPYGFYKAQGEAATGERRRDFQFHMDSIGKTVPRVCTRKPLSIPYGFYPVEFSWAPVSLYRAFNSIWIL